MKNKLPQATASTQHLATISVPKAAKQFSIPEPTIDWWISRGYIVPQDGKRLLRRIDLFLFLLSDRAGKHQIPVTIIPFTDIPDGSANQPRRATDQATVARYVEAFKNGEKDNFPPLDVAEQEGALVVCNGFHRLAAHREVGSTMVPVRVIKNATPAEVIVLAVRLNRENALPLSKDDMRKAAKEVIQRLGINKLTDKIALQVAESLGCSLKTIWRAADALIPREPKSRPGATRNHALRGIEAWIKKLEPTDPELAAKFSNLIVEAKSKAAKP